MYFVFTIFFPPFENLSQFSIFFFKLYIFEESLNDSNIKKKHCAFKTQPNSPTNFT